MQTEKEYLAEVSKMLDAIQRVPTERRKFEMRRTLHGKYLSKRQLYGFQSIDQVRQSIGYMKVGKPDPTRNQRCEFVKRFIETLKTVVTEMEKTMHQEATPTKAVEPSTPCASYPFRWEKCMDIEKESSSLDDKEIDEELDRD